MKLALLGATGSIGTQALDVLSGFDPDTFQLSALAAGRRVDRLAGQIERFRPQLVCVAGPDEADRLAARLKASVEIVHGPEGLIQCAAESGAERVLNALVGSAGLPPTLAALEAGIDVALANKESLVVGGQLVKEALACGGAQLLPVDSEHSALWQLLEGREPEEVARLWITASGGALRDWPLERLKDAAPDDVLKHPNWNMGARITVDSATLVNKAFELIEAHWLFSLPYERMRALLHPQSVVHGLVELADGAFLAHLGAPDMRVPIQFALTAPRHRPLDAPRLDWAGLRLDFGELDPARYPAFGAVVEAGKAGGTAPAVANAADEVLVSRFLNGEIPFTDIAAGIREALECHDPQPATLEAIQAADRWARGLARAL